MGHMVFRLHEIVTSGHGVEAVVIDVWPAKAYALQEGLPLVFGEDSYRLLLVPEAGETAQSITLPVRVAERIFRATKRFATRR